MNLSKTESLFLYSLLFQISGSDWDPATKEQISNMMSNIEIFLTGEESACRPSQTQDQDQDQDEYEDEDEDEYEDEDEETGREAVEEPDNEKIEHHFLVPASDLQDLPAQDVKNSIGEKVTVQFEDVDFRNAVDVLVNEGSILLPEITTIKVTDKTIEFHDGEDWEVFTYKRLCKAWANIFKLDYAYGIGDAQ